MKEIEENKLKKTERADRFGIETKDMLKEKVIDRKERFKTQGYQPDEGEK